MRRLLKRGGSASPCPDAPCKNGMTVLRGSVGPAGLLICRRFRWIVEDDQGCSPARGLAPCAALILRHVAASIQLDVTAVQQQLLELLASALNPRLCSRERDPQPFAHLALGHAFDFSHLHGLSVGGREALDHFTEAIPDFLVVVRCRRIFGNHDLVRQHFFRSETFPEMVQQSVASDAVDPRRRAFRDPSYSSLTRRRK